MTEKLTRVVKYGIEEIIEGKEILRELSSTSHDFYKDVLEVRVQERKNFREIRRRFSPECQRIEDQMEAIYTEIENIHESIRTARQKNSTKGGKVRPTRTPATPEQKKRLAELRAEAEKLKEENKKAKDAFKKTVLDPADRAFELRASGIDPELATAISETGEALKKAKKIKDNPKVPTLQRQLDDLKSLKRKTEKKTAARKKSNEATFQEMLKEPQWPEAWKQIKAQDFKTRSEINRIQTASGLPHGCYLEANKATQTSMKTAKTDPEPEKKPWKGGRKVGMQIRTSSGEEKLTVAKALEGTDSRFQIRDVQPLRGIQTSRKKRQEQVPGSNKERQRYAVADLKINKDTKISVAFRMHRPLPTDAKITWVYIQPKRIGFRIHYTLQITLDLNQPLIERSRGTGDCILRLGWAGLPTTDDKADLALVVATSPEETERIVLPPSVYGGELYGKEHLAAADIIFRNSEKTGAVQQFAAWYKENKKLAPSWMTKETKNIANWNGHGKLAKIALRWIAEYDDVIDYKELYKNHWRRYNNVKNRRRKGKDPNAHDLYMADREQHSKWLESKGITDPILQMAIWLEWWRVKDKHLITVARNRQHRAQKRRNDFYKCEAVRLSRKYDTLGLYELNLAQTARTAPTEDDEDPIIKKARHQRKVAAVSELKAALKNAFGSRFREIKREKTEGTKKKSKKKKPEKPVAAE